MAVDEIAVSIYGFGQGAGEGVWVRCEIDVGEVRDKVDDRVPAGSEGTAVRLDTEGLGEVERVGATKADGAGNGCNVCSWADGC